MASRLKPFESGNSQLHNHRNDMYIKVHIYILLEDMKKKTVEFEYFLQQQIGYHFFFTCKYF